MTLGPRFRPRLPAGALVLACASVLAAVAAVGASPPQIVFTSESCDLGSIVQGELPACEFTFTNGGTEDLRVLQVEPSCGCTSALPSAPVVGAGARGAIRVVFDSENFVGDIVKEVKVHTNDPARPSRTLVVRALVEPEIEFEPRPVTFDGVRPGAASRQVVMLTNRRAEPVRVLSTSVSPESWSCRFAGGNDLSRPLVLEPWDRVPLEVRFTAPAAMPMPVSGECLLEIAGPRLRFFRLKLLALPGL